MNVFNKDNENKNIKISSWYMERIMWDIWKNLTYIDSLLLWNILCYLKAHIKCFEQ